MLLFFPFNNFHTTVVQSTLHVRKKKNDEVHILPCTFAVLHVSPETKTTKMHSESTQAVAHIPRMPVGPSKLNGKQCTCLELTRL